MRGAKRKEERSDMTHHENLSMMDTVTTKYGRTSFVTVSRTLAIILVVIFFICLIATGLLVYSFTSTCPKNETRLGDAEQVSRTTSCSVQVKQEEAVSTTMRAVVTLPPPSTTFKTDGALDIDKDLDIRLPRSIKPRSYRLHLTPFLEQGNFTFHGKVTILVEVTKTCSNITLHAQDLIIDTVSVMDAGNNTVSIKDVRTVSAKQFLVIDLDEELVETNQYYVFVVFKGVLNDMLQGFYRSSYVENSVTRWIAATQFQATDARKAFPCFDEPALKAKFQISIARPKNMSSISNMRRMETSDHVDNLPGYAWDHYEESLPMSTYLVAFVVSDFQHISNGNCSIWARPSALSQAQYSVKIGPSILKYYEQFFGIEYPLPKLDMVAIPDFSAGAMENWGLITYREPVLLYENGVSSKSSLQRIAHVVAHELAHQWFGNLVTPAWWEDLWLNEGFATYVEFLGAHAVQPKWKDLDLFLVSELHESFTLDSLKSSHPISVKVYNPDEVNDIFDRISYSKGASIIRMMQHFLGQEVFHKGLNTYLKNRMYGSAEQDDLWYTLTQESQASKSLPDGTTVKQIMDTWTLQTGYPIVTAMRQPDRSVTLIQQRFLLDRDEQHEDDTLWWVPITILDSQDRQTNAWLSNVKETTVENALDADVSWFLINVNQTGYYRVNYEVENWKKLMNQLLGNGHVIFTPTNRAQMLDDALNLAFAGYLSYDVALNVTKYLVNEREYVAWKAALNNFEFLHNMLVRTAHFDKFKVYITALLQDFYEELGFKEASKEDPTRVLNRMEIINQACKLGVKDCVLQAVQQFQNWRNSANPDKENFINPDLRETVYCTAIGVGGLDEWDFAWSRYLKTNVATDKEILLSALACSKETWILSRYLEWSITDNSGIRKHDIARVFAAVSANPVGHDLAYKFLKSNWNRIREHLGPSSMSLSSLVRTSTAKFNTDEEVDDFKSFFQRKKEEFGIATRTAEQSIEQIEANTRWMKKHYQSIVNWLENFKNGYFNG
ncbi:aminopeptidase N [Cylas formicarius]|uniref:aminopeptidase N n=1 Tax=Cylas formicarius TaxID=197179 RepID=UPI0029583DEE|nr:aminopeptidase N [Cylas formicarius]